MAEPFLELIGISKTYPGVVALDRGRASPSRRRGHRPDRRERRRQVDADEDPRRRHRADQRHDPDRRRASTPRSPSPTRSPAGIAFVHQELNLFDNLDVAANVFIGREPLHGGPLKLVDRKALHAQVQPLLDRLGAISRPTRRSPSCRWRRSSWSRSPRRCRSTPRLVIMDEPTSSLTLAETDRLHEASSPTSRRSGVSVIFISHRLNEVERCADRVVVLRDGRVVGELDRERDHPRRA